MKKAFFIIAMAASMTFGAAAQNSDAFMPVVNLGYTYYNGLTIPRDGGSRYSIVDRTIHLSGSAIMIDADLWRVTRNISAGLHLGVMEAAYNRISTREDVVVPGLHYGIDMRLHLLPDARRFDLCFAGMLGSYWSKHATPLPEYGASIVLTYYPLAHLGVFAEAAWGQYFYAEHDPYGNITNVITYGTTMFKAGISYRFAAPAK